MRLRTYSQDAMPWCEVPSSSKLMSRHTVGVAILSTAADDDADDDDADEQGAVATTARGAAAEGFVFVLCAH